MSQGQEGKPGEPPIGQQGGRGGEGGRGGQGLPEGPGGQGGQGGRGAQGKQGKQGNPGREGLPPVWKALLTLWIIGFTIVVISLYEANHNRIDDIQKSRIDSCKANYEGIRKVFSPLATPAKTRTAKEAEQLEKFNRTINRLKRTCREQVSLKQ